MKRELAFLCLAAAAAAAHAQVRDWLTSNDARNGSTVSDFLAAVQRVDKVPAYRDEYARRRANVGLVFVPGILGSALTSRDGEKIWGYGLSISKALPLPAALVDPVADSGVQAALADGNGTLDLYGDAIALIRANAARAGIAPGRIVACGYDWRRDVRSGARDLKRCIEGAPGLQGVEALVVIAHSMGGLVTVQWHRDYAPEGVLPGGAQVLAVALLGSPLAGSCEIVRMISKGYIQPTANDRHAKEGWIGRFATEIGAMKDRVVNAVTGIFSDDVRPMVLTWPGALDLTPRPAASKDDPNCAELPLTPGDDTDPRVLTQYDIPFWTGPVGTGFLAGKPLPPGYDAVLAAASDFRTGFALEPLKSPTYLFASETWDTPMQAKLVPPTYAPDSRGDWHTVDGDGRVPFNSAMPTAIQSRAADARRVYSVHGNLAEDKVFHEEFLVQRLPRILEGWNATLLLKKAAGDPEFLAAYWKAGGRPVNNFDMLSAYERQSEANQRDPIYALTVEAWNSAWPFNEALCRVAACPDYQQARAAAANAASAEKAAILSAALHSSALSGDEEMFMRAKRGLAMADQVNWVAAIGDLRIAVPWLDARAKGLGAQEKPNERELRVNATAILARALVMRGFCAEAKPYVGRVPADHRWAADLRKAQCFDRDTGRIVALR